MQLRETYVSARRKITVGFAVALLMLTMAGIASYVSIVQYQRNSRWVAHTHEVLERLDDVFGDLRDAEAAQRSFILTGDTDHIDIWRRGVERTNSNAVRIVQLVVDNPEQEVSANQLRAMIVERFQRMQENIDVRRSHGFDSARARVMTGTGDSITALIRQQVAIMQNIERSLLSSRADRMDRSGRRSEIIIALALLIAFVIVTYSAMLIERELKERERAERAALRDRDEAEAANRAKSDFLARMSHELRTPLNSVIGFANVLLKNKKGTFSTQDLSFLDRIVANGRHLLELINDILDLAKIEAGKIELKIEDADVLDLVRETVLHLEPRSSEKGVRLVTEMPRQARSITTDPHRLKQVLINLIGNAVKFTANGEVRIRVRVDQSNRPVRMDVIDTGIGIPEDRVRAIFEAFEQADVSTTRKFGGTGLGLAISRALCHSLGYDLAVESQVGVGSTFSIIMSNAVTAASDGDAQITVAETTSAFPRVVLSDEEKRSLNDLRESCVLIIDDDPDSRALLHDALSELGIGAIVAADGEEGLELARERKPDAILLDLIMPNVGGWEVVRRLQEDKSTHEIPVIVVSMVAGASRGVLLGPVEFLDKPVEQATLLSALQPYLADGKSRVLLVENDSGTREVLRAQIETRGADVRSVASGRDAIRMLQNYSPNLLVLDLSLTDMTGPEVIAAMRSDSRTSDIPVVVVTGPDLPEPEVSKLRNDGVTVLRRGSALNSDLEEILQRVLS